MSGLKAEQIAASNIVGHGCKSGIKADHIFEFPIFTAHHFRYTLRYILAQPRHLTDHQQRAYLAAAARPAINRAI